MKPDARSSEKFQELVRNAAAQLVSFEYGPSGGYVSTPLLYSSGSYVVVRVEGNGDSFFVSDFGTGLQEAQLIGGEFTYRRVAKQVAEANGVQFDTFAFFALTVSEAQLPGAIATVANASQEAVNVTSLKVSEKAYRDDSAALYDRLTAIFRPDAVAKDAQLVGASNTEWRVASLVTIGNREVAFETVTNHANSIVFAATKFADLKLLKRPPGRVAVVASKPALGTYLGVLTQAASVVERGDRDPVFHRLLEGASP